MLRTRWAVAVTTATFVVCAATVTAAAAGGEGATRLQTCARAGGEARTRIGCTGPRSGGAARADYNGDGVTDLAIGVPFEDSSAGRDIGIVGVMYGSLSDGLDGVLHVYRATSIGVTPAAGDEFGYSLAGGDFDGDGISDLAIGAPGRDVGGVRDAGTVYVLFGSESGLTTRHQTVVQGSTQAPESRESGDRLGESLVWGNFGNGPAADLAMGVPFENVGSIADAGVLHIAYGGSGGLGIGQTFSQGVGFPGSPQTGTGFGQMLAAGNVGDSAEDDLAIGMPYRDVGDVGNAGTVMVAYGSSAGAPAGSIQAFTELTSGISGSPELFDLFGFSLAIGNFNGSGPSELAIGVPFGSSEGIDAGVVHVLPSVNGGRLTANGSQLWAQRVSGVPGTARSSELFGWSLASGDFDGNGAADLAVGVPGDSDRGADAAGAVNVLYGVAGSGVATIGAQYWSQGDSRGTFGTPEPHDNFGTALSAWNWGKGFQADLAVGTPFENHGDIPDSGLVQVFYGSGSRLTTSGQLLIEQASIEAGDRFGTGLY